MPRLAIQDEKISLEDFRTLEANAPRDERWELIDGTIWRMMAGGTLAHNEIIHNIVGRLGPHLRSARPQCRLYTENARIESSSGDLSTLPDIAVRCGPRPRDAKAMRDPVLVVEVLSPGTRAKDEGQKTAGYLRLPSLQDYVLVEQAFPFVRHHRRLAEAWTEETRTKAVDLVEIASLGFQISLGDIYEVSSK